MLKKKYWAYSAQFSSLIDEVSFDQIKKMSFFNSLQQYVTSGVAGLGLSPRRFSLSRQDSSEQQLQQQSPSIVQAERRESGNSQHHGKN